MDDDHVPLLAAHGEDWTAVRVPATGLMHYTGISSTYSTAYPEALRNVLSREEFVDIIGRLNETIRDYWPCNTCYFFGYGCCLCTAGLSVLIPGYCISHSELYATAMLRNVSLKAKYYDRNISFALVKKLCGSYVEVRFPGALGRGEDVEGLVTPAPAPSAVFISSQPSRLKEL